MIEDYCKENPIVFEIKKKRWIKGHLGRFWNKESYQNLEYVKQPITKEEIDDWVSKGYDYVKSYTGSMYDNKNPMPDWTNNIPSTFPEFRNMTFTLYRMDTLEIMPEHVDHFRTYRKLYNLEHNECYRMLIMLEDWKPGHYLEIDGNGFINWIAGDYFIWRAEVPHAASNIGIDPKYTLQITCSLMQIDEAWNMLHCYNIPDLTTAEVSTTWYMKRVLDVIDDSIKEKPMYIYMFNGFIKKLENVQHDEETINHLNTLGLTFYLTEPLCSYIHGAPQLFSPNGTKHDMLFYSEFRGDESSAQFRADELDCISEYVKKNNLLNVTVYTCDYDVDNWYPHYASLFKLKYDDLFVKSLQPKNILDPIVEPTFTKKFMCLNWRYTPHRHFLAAYVAAKDSYVSWFFRGDLAVIGTTKWFNMHSLSEKHPDNYIKFIQGIGFLNKHAPISLDVKVETAITILENRYSMRYLPAGTIADFTDAAYQSETIEKLYKDIFVNLVTESRFAQPTGNYSEKTYHPMWYKKPFILAAPPFTLKCLREQGFKTFGDFWDETYDEITNHEERLYAIMSVIDEIDSKSIEELQSMYIKMQDILEFNYNKLLITLNPLELN